MAAALILAPAAIGAPGIIGDIRCGLPAPAGNPQTLDTNGTYPPAVPDPVPKNLAHSATAFRP